MIQDLHFALRQLRRSPGFAAVAILTLALAIGVSTAVFSVLDATLIRPLPFDNPQSILTVQPRTTQGYGNAVSWPQYKDWSQNPSLQAFTGYKTSSLNLESGTTASAVRAVDTTDTFFDVFAVKPLLGRTFLPGEDQAGHNDVVVLSYELWQSAFAAQPSAIGSVIRVDGVPTTVIGVMPAGFRYPLSLAGGLYRPMHLPAGRYTARGQHFMRAVARIKPGVTLAEAQGSFNNMQANLLRSNPGELGLSLNLKTISDSTIGKTRGPLLVLAGAVLGVLLLGCVNVAGLLLARGVRRQRELALRTALGAGRARVTRQLLTESAVLSLAGAAVGILLAAALLQLIRQLLVQSLARGSDIHLNLPVLAVTVLISILTGLLAALLPATQSARIAPSLSLRSGGAAGTSRGQNHLRSSLIAIQIAIALSLLVCSGLLLRHLGQLRSTDLGFSPVGLLTEELTLTRANYAGRDMMPAFYDPLLDRVRTLPGVASAGVINMLPIFDYGNNGDMTIVGHPAPAPNADQLAEIRAVTPAVLETLGAHVVAGRGLDRALDLPDGQIHVVVNQAFVKKFFAAGEDPIGQHIDWGQEKPLIVGVLSNLHQQITMDPMAEMDLDTVQIPKKFASDELNQMFLVVRATPGIAPASLAASVREAMHQIDPTVPFRAPLTMDNIIADQLTFQRLQSWLFGIFAALALTLSLVGIYGMIHHEVELRKRDIGVRMALGSTRARVVRDILQRVTFLMLLGVTAGWLLTLALQKTISAVVILDTTHNLGLLLLLTSTLALFGVAASLLPARRAASIQPTEALRAD